MGLTLQGKRVALSFAPKPGTNSIGKQQVFIHAFAAKDSAPTWVPKDHEIVGHILLVLLVALLSIPRRLYTVHVNCRAAYKARSKSIYPNIPKRWARR